MENRQKVKDIMIDLRRGDIGWVTAQDKICALFTIIDAPNYALLCKNHRMEYVGGKMICLNKGCGWETDVFLTK